MDAAGHRRVEYGACLLDSDGLVKSFTPGFPSIWESCGGVDPRSGHALSGEIPGLRSALDRVRGGLEDSVFLENGRRSRLLLTLSPMGGDILGSIMGHPDDYAQSQAEAQMAMVAARLQAILSSAVDLDSSIQDAGTIYETTFVNIAAAIPFETGTIQMLDGDQLEVVATHGFPNTSSVEGLRFPLDERFPNQWVIRGRNALALDDIRVDFPHFTTEEGEFESGHIRTWMGVPLMDRGEVIGMLTMDRTRIDPFEPDEIELAQALANHAAVALSNARMYHSLEEANRKQDVLLHELHHRVKNNLQLISSLLNLRAVDVDDRTRDVISDLGTHVHALAATHENLFRAGISEDVLIAPYVRDVLREVEAVNVVSGSDIVFRESIPEALHCPMDIAVPLGLIISELALNAVKHAFPDGGGGEISVSIDKRPSSLVVVVADTGCGFDPDHRASAGFGMTLVSTLADQLNASLSHHSTNKADLASNADTRPERGSRWAMEFPFD